MTEAAQQILDEFHSLPDADRRLVLRELLREALAMPYESMPDEALVSAADDVFLGLDRREDEECGHP